MRAELPQTVSAPVRKGQTFGTLVISCGETEVGRVDLVSARSVQAQETKSETSKNKSLAEKLWELELYSEMLALTAAPWPSQVATKSVVAAAMAWKLASTFSSGGTG